MTTLIPKYDQGNTGAVNRPINQKLAETISVLDFGADPTGTTDSTAAFNLATQSTATWSTNLQYQIVIPSGVGIKFRIDGTVYVRGGQTLYGDGDGTTIDCSHNTNAGPIFVVGGNASGTDGAITSKIHNIHTVGGPSSYGVIKGLASGIEISSCFLSAAGIGIDIQNCNDVIISDCVLDTPLLGMLIGSTQTAVITNVNIFWPLYGIQFNSNCKDIAISNSVIQINKTSSIDPICGILFATSQSNINGLIFSNIGFVTNQQSTGNFLGYVYNRASNVTAQFTGCSFRNMYKWAVNNGTGSGNYLTFTGCVFDGSDNSSSGFQQSTTAMGVNLGTTSSSFKFYSCEFRNLLGEIATIQSGSQGFRLSFIGGAVINCTSTPLNFTEVITDNSKVSVKNVVDFFPITLTSSYACAVLPYWGYSTGWKVAIKGSGIGSNLCAAEEAAYTVNLQYNGTNLAYVDKMLIWQTPTRSSPGNLSAVACFGTTPGGSTTQSSYTTPGFITISVSGNTASNLDWYFETIT